MEIIPARRGRAVRAKAGERIRVVNIHGTQVVDTWALVEPDLTEFMSMEHTRPTVGRLVPAVGESFVTTTRRPILTLLEDTSGGVHDTLMAACDRYRYQLLGCEGYHDSCTDNFHAAMAELGLRPPELPCPLNLFQNTPVEPDRDIGKAAPVATPGSHVTLGVELDAVVVFSACPQDMVPTNGVDCTPRDAGFEILS